MSANKHLYLIILALLSFSLIYFFIPEEPKSDTLASYDGIVLSDIQGQQFKLTGQLTEKPIMFVFWSVTCGTCIEEMPFISKLHDEMSDKVTIIGIHPPKFPIKKIQKFVKRRKPPLPYMLAIDVNGTLIKNYEITVMPRIVLLNRQGKVLYDHLGYSPEPNKEGEVKNAIVSALL